MSEQQRPESDVNVAVKVTGDSVSGFNFAYAGPYFDGAGNFNFVKSELKGKSVRIHFAITGDSTPGARFKPLGEDAFWIVEESVVGPDGCPGGPYQGAQFREWVTGPDRLQLHVLDINNDGLRYRYALRFDINGETVMHDPGGSNNNGG